MIAAQELSPLSSAKAVVLLIGTNNIGRAPQPHRPTIPPLSVPTATTAVAL